MRDGTPPVIIDAALARHCSPTRIRSARCCSSAPIPAARTEADGDRRRRTDHAARSVRVGSRRSISIALGGTSSERMFVYARAAPPQNGDAMVITVRDQLRAVDASMPMMSVKSFRSQHEASAQVWILRAAAQMFLTLGLAAAFVAVVGLYGVRSYLVSTTDARVRRAHGDWRIADGRDASGPARGVPLPVWPGDRPGTWRAARLGLQRDHLSSQAVRSDDPWLCYRHPGAGLGGGVSRSRPPRRERDADGGAPRD